MEETEYIGPAGQTQRVDSLVVATRLRAAGWQPRAELEEAAPTSPAASEQLERAKQAAAERERRVQARKAAAEPQLKRGSAQSAEPTSAVAETEEQSASEPAPTGRKQRSKSSV